MVSPAEGSERRVRCLTAIVFLLGSLVNGCRRELIDVTRASTAIASLEECAEDVFDLAEAGLWSRAATRMSVLRESTARFEADEGRQFPELERAIADLDRAVGARDVRRSGHSANEVMRQTVVLASPYLEKDRASILLLDVEAREVLVQAEVDSAAADVAIGRIADLWTELRPGVELRGGTDLLARCDTHLANLSIVRSSFRKDEARALLETVDQLENLYSEQPRPRVNP